METLADAADAVALAQAVLGAIEAGQREYAVDRCDRLAEVATELGARLRREEAAHHAGMELLDVERELERLRDPLIPDEEFGKE